MRQVETGVNWRGETGAGVFTTPLHRCLLPVGRSTRRFVVIAATCVFVRFTWPFDVFDHLIFAVCEWDNIDHDLKLLG